MRGIGFLRLNRNWCEILQSSALAGISANHPCLYQKLQRPYLNCRLNTRQRFYALENHYHFVATCFSPGAIKKIYAKPAGSKQGSAGPGILLAELPLEEVGQLGLRLGFSWQEKEGDLAISLVNLETGVNLFSLTFSIPFFWPGAGEIFIGGLQGNKRANGKDEVVAITRGLHGLRPKALLLFTLQELAGIWGIARLRAVSDANHIYRHWQKKRPIAASYDQSWLESGGQLAADGMFDLPATFVPREVNTLKVNKRQLYRRRYQQMAGIGAQIRASQIGTLRSLAPQATDVESSLARHDRYYKSVPNLLPGLLGVDIGGNNGRHLPYSVSLNQRHRPACPDIGREELE